MAHDIAPKVWSLNDQQALDACAALATALEVELQAPQLDTSDFPKLLNAGSETEQKFHQDLQAANLSLSQAAEAARSMLLLAADLGYTAQVDSAVAAALEHGRDFGVISGPLLLAGLAVVLAYVPVEQRVTVQKIHHRSQDGTETEVEVTDSKTIRVGAAAVEKLAEWWKAMLGG